MKDKKIAKKPNKAYSKSRKPKAEPKPKSEYPALSGSIDKPAESFGFKKGILKRFKVK